MPDAAVLLDLLAQRPATLDAGRLLCLDGPAGSGKTTLAEAVARQAVRRGTVVRVVHLDDLYVGWEGLDGVAGSLADLLAPLASGRAGSYCRYDWHAGRLAERVVVEPVELLVLEGVGSGGSTTAAHRTVLAWVEAPPALRLARGLARDGEGLREHWGPWQAREQAHFARERTREHATVLLDGTGSRAPIGPRAPQA